MKKLEKNFTYLYVTLLLIIAGNTTITQMFLFTGERKFGVLSKERIVLLLYLITIIVGVLVSKKSLQITFSKVKAFYILFVFLISSFILSFVNSSEGFEKVTEVFFSYYWVTLFVIILGMNINFMEEKYVKRAFSMFFFIQCILGIMQYTFNKPFVFTTFNGEPVLNTIYYLNGMSSASDILYSMGAQVRAFGLTDSGLTLGMFSLALFSCYFYNLSSSNGREKMRAILIMLVALICAYMTITRNIYVTGLFLLLLLLFLNKVSSKKILFVKIMYVLLIIGNFLYVSFAEELFKFIAQVIPEFNIETLFSRLIGYQQVFNKVKFDVSHILFGSGVVPSRQLYIDNDFLYTYANIGLVSYVLMQIIYMYILFKGLNGLRTKAYNSRFLKGLLIFLVTYPFASWISTVIYVYFILAILAYVIMKNEDKKLNT
ncbi:hypothetical protein ETJ91_19825 [Bacillus albus]|uniref:hypothetical protein n=1 Tax=Bacillus albus TaxID=2026189 RepID=UPI001009E9DC|nr:hypothetical protein [Bacillus albus]RXJ16155.1 hypothetical protein ETJ91_19825 [Bacillus albus]RXJ25354.1 hypothetical protein ETJ90_19580 [Bacillus albus]RXJ29406.1 hypothetical protein ETJ76_17590 [Bacillus albus]RXJ38503.1 hypothetical protein ETJ89_18705 [Bacillus albus]RXJ54987.1 hypothetical protein ETJ66_18945 [Bacillus albus]